MVSAMRAHLFLCIDNGRYALSNDGDGANLPKAECVGGWRFVRALDVEVERPLPLAANPEPILRALADVGYYLLGTDDIPHGTSQ
jgi:hypothetical protein